MKGRFVIEGPRPHVILTVLLFVAFTAPAVSQPAKPIVEVLGARYLKVTPIDTGEKIAMRLVGQSCGTLTSCGHCLDASGVDTWIQPDGTLSSDSTRRDFTEWNAAGFAVRGDGIFPDAFYEVRAVNEADQEAVADIVKTFRWGDTNGDCEVDDTDSACVVDQAGGGPDTADCTKKSADFTGGAWPLCGTPDGFINIDDMLAVFDAIGGACFPCAGSEPCAPRLKAVGSRYLEVSAQPWHQDVSIRISGAACAACDTCRETTCLEGLYVQEDGSLGLPPAPRPWSEWSRAIINSSEIVPDAQYVARAEAVGSSGPYSDKARTYIWGDIDNDGVLDSDDLDCVNDLIGGAPETVDCKSLAADLTGGGPAALCQLPDGSLGLDDLLAVLDAGAGIPFPCAGPCPCNVEDSFENGAIGWVNDPVSTCTTGSYVLGNPNLQQSGSLITQVDGARTGTSAFFTQPNTALGTDDVDGGNCVLTSPIFPVDEASKLAIYYFHGQRDTGDDPIGDFFLLELSLDGGLTYTPLASNGDTASSAVWTQATASIPTGSDVRVRLQCSDGTSGGDIIECGLDDLSICPH